MQNCKSQTLLNKNQGTTTFVKISPLLQTHLHSEAQCVIRLGIGKNKNIRQPDNTTAVNKSEQNKIICSSEEEMVDLDSSDNLKSAISWIIGITI